MQKMLKKFYIIFKNSVCLKLLNSFLELVICLKDSRQVKFKIAIYNNKTLICD